MAEVKEKIILSRSDGFGITENNGYYRLDKGKLNMFLAPIENGRPVNLKSFAQITDARGDKFFPGYRRLEAGHQEYALVYEAATEEVEISVLDDKPNSILHQRFLKRANINTYEYEGFEKSLFQFYTKNIIKTNARADKEDIDEKKAPDDIAHVIINAFNPFGSNERSGVDYYQALQFLCQRMGIDLLSSDKVKARCGKSPSLTDIAKASHFICRKIVLESDWYKSDCGGFVGMIDKEVVACLPDHKGRYQIFRTSDESVSLVTPELAAQISPHAYAVGRTLPHKPLSKKDVVAFCKKSITKRDLIPYIGLVLIYSLIGVLLPTINGKIYDDYIPVGNIGNLTEICMILLTFMVGNVAFSIVKNLFGYRMSSRMGNDLQNAVYHRLFHLPESFFRKYDSADLAGRVSSIGPTATGYANAFIVSGISALFAVFYALRMFKYNKKLTWLSLALYAVYLIISIWITSLAHKGQTRISEAESEAGGKLYQYLNGVDKIRMAGVENRALRAYMKPYARRQYEEIRVNRLVSIEEALTTVAKFCFSIVIYWYIVKKLKIENLSSGSFVAFNSAFGMLMGALGTFIDEVLKLFQERNEIERFWPVFSATPEDDDEKEIPGPITGNIKLDKVSFSYEKGGKTVLNDISLTIQPGDYIGIVGASGCGKSTLLKLLLGFETPQSGSVLVDQKDLRDLNKSAYRRQLGVVLQNGKLISGTISENITITTPNATLADVKKVVSKVGLDEDIAQMPMGLNTMLGENCNTISGGQQQRILIARAICGDPKLLIFDEATSALDNVTQAAVSKTLDEMKCTRIVVAHRLSTIKQCKRILVMNQGEIVEDGTYDSLMAKNGLFTALANRQIAE